jgi:hypothetical protein
MMNMHHQLDIQRKTTVTGKPAHDREVDLRMEGSVRDLDPVRGITLAVVVTIAVETPKVTGCEEKETEKGNGAGIGSETGIGIAVAIDIIVLEMEIATVAIAATAIATEETIGTLAGNLVRHRPSLSCMVFMMARLQT